jgi:hypothetical protein
LYPTELHNASGEVLKGNESAAQAGGIHVFDALTPADWAEKFVGSCTSAWHKSPKNNKAKPRAESREPRAESREPRATFEIPFRVKFRDFEIMLQFFEIVYTAFTVDRHLFRLFEPLEFRKKYSFIRHIALRDASAPRCAFVLP